MMGLKWEQWRDVGRILRHENEKGNDDKGDACKYRSDDTEVSKMVESLKALESENKLQDEVWGTLVRQYGIPGPLVLCSLQSLSHPCDILMAVIHVIFINECNITSISNVHTDEESPRWPELFPFEWCTKEGSFPTYSLDYKSSSNIVHLKGALMGSRLILNVSIDCDDDFAPHSEFVVKDFIDNVQNINSEIDISVVLKKSSVAQVVSCLDRDILITLRNKLDIKKPCAVSTSETNSRLQSETSSNCRNLYPNSVFPPANGGGFRGPGLGPYPNPGMIMPPPGGQRIRPQAPGYFGDDLSPFGGTGGGMLFGPGNIGFDGVPSRGAPRFDPYGPPGFPGSYPGGEPRPDHLRPPDHGNFM